jgi:hypothetical protein
MGEGAPIMRLWPRASGIIRRGAVCRAIIAALVMLDTIAMGAVTALLWRSARLSASEIGWT